MRFFLIYFTSITGAKNIVSNFYAEDIVGFFKLYRGSAVVKQKTDVGFCDLTLEILRKTL